MKIKKRKLFLYSISLFAVVTFGYVKYYNMNINDIGLKVLGWVKILKGDAVDLNKLSSINTPTMKHDNWTTILEKQVTATGQVNYKGIVEDPILLEKYLAELTEHPPGDNWTEEEQLAYWINAYNAFTVKLIVDNYPLKSIKNIADGLPMISSPWDIKFFKIGDVDFDLNTIEHEVLRKKFNEPRIHFAINCASFSCPKLRNEAYTASKLEEQLEEQTSGFINDIDKNVISDTETKLSKIFDWFKSDFTKKSDLSSFLKKYNPSLNEKNKVTYMEYIWTLND